MTNILNCNKRHDINHPVPGRSRVAIKKYKLTITKPVNKYTIHKCGEDSNFSSNFSRAQLIVDPSVATEGIKDDDAEGGEPFPGMSSSITRSVKHRKFRKTNNTAMAIQNVLRGVEEDCRLEIIQREQNHNLHVLQSDGNGKLS